ncbi:MAG: DUF192 domain-containing protein [Candidatus Omnitrophica bacterium]|nr:DUF192 domain-containing protein [Candidatus Omnitrophota bacterium]
MKDSNSLLLKITCFLLLFSSICHAGAIAPQVCHRGNCVTVEVVSKREDMERGLMYRSHLEQNRGMLFVFTADDKHLFWMKNMHFNLDILWIGVDGRIIFIGQNIPACSSDPCPIYAPDQKSRFVLELNSGYTASHRWNAGDKLDLKGI